MIFVPPIEFLIAAGNFYQNQHAKMKTPLETAQAEYIKFLQEDAKSTAGFLHVHHWKWPEEVIKKGQELRDEIASLEKLSVEQSKESSQHLWRVEQLVDVLTSVRAICQRKGEDTAWETLDRRIELLGGIGSVTAKVFKNPRIEPIKDSPAVEPQCASSPSKDDPYERIFGIDSKEQKPQCTCGFDEKGWRDMNYGEKIERGDQVFYNGAWVESTDIGGPIIVYKYRTRRHKPDCPELRKPDSPGVSTEVAPPIPQHTGGLSGTLSEKVCHDCEDIPNCPSCLKSEMVTQDASFGGDWVCHRPTCRLMVVKTNRNKPENPKLDLSEEIEVASDALHKGESMRIRFIAQALRKIQDHLNS